MSDSESKIEYRHFYGSPSGGGDAIYLYWVEPGSDMELPYKVEMIRKWNAWYKRIARKSWINEELFEWGETYCAGCYRLIGDTNQLYLTENNKNRFLSNRESFSHLHNFCVTDLGSGKRTYYTDDYLDNLDSRHNLYLN